MSSKKSYFILHPKSMLRGCGGSAFFPFRPAFALQLLYPECTIKIYYIALHYFSYALIQAQLCTPKFQPKHMIIENQELVHQEFSRNTIIHDGSYIIDPGLPQVRDSRSNEKKVSFEESCFNEFILKKHNDNNLKPAAVVSCIVGKDFFNNLSERIYDTLGVDFPSHLIDFAACLNENRRELLPLLNKHKTLTRNQFSIASFTDERFPFWSNTKLYNSNSYLYQTKYFPIKSKL